MVGTECSNSADQREKTFCSGPKHTHTLQPPGTLLRAEPQETQLDLTTS